MKNPPFTFRSARRLFPIFCVIYLIAASTAYPQFRITEFMASNTRTLADEDGSFEDWIEIQNISTATVNLFDWALTDKAGNLAKWKFPATNLAPSEFLVVFASNKDRRAPGAPLHTNFKLSAAGGYLALVDASGTNIATEFAAYPGQVPDVSYGIALTVTNISLVATGATARVLAPSAANGGSMLNYSWTGSAANEPFDAASWMSGATGIGFGVPNLGLNIQAGMLNSNASAFIRLPFVVDNPANLMLLTLRMKYDDGFVAWINGMELTRANAPYEDLAWNSSATRAHAGADFETMAFGIATNLLRAGANILAIQGLNVAATNASFLILPELSGAVAAGESGSGLYFTQPTPGAENLGGSGTPGPGIANVKHAPNVPLVTDPLTVTATVFPTARAVASVALHYRVMFGSEITVTMLDDGNHGDGAAGDGIYGATIPAASGANGQMVRYYITAQDTVAVSSRLPVFSDPTATAQYFGTVYNPNSVTSTLPVIHLFAPATVLQPGPVTSQIGADSDAGGYVSVYYDGEFYDNVFMWLRGNSTADYPKKSHRITFNKEHPFRHSGPGGRIRKTSFVADYADPTYMRQGLSFWLCNETGADGPFYNPVRLQLNGAFYQLANHNDIHGEELLGRLGYDPNGALYNAMGTIQYPITSTGGWDKKTRLWDAGDADYIAFAAAIDESNPTGRRMTNIFDRLDIPQVISYMVAARFAHENDDVWANMSIYHDNDGDDLWRIIPFDMNLSWGAAYLDDDVFSGIQVTNDNLKSFPLYGSSQAVTDIVDMWNRLYDVVFTVPQTREMFLRRMRTVLDEYVKPPGTPSTEVPVAQKVMEWRNQIATEAQLDRAWWGWPPKDGQSNFDPGIDLTNGVNILLSDFLDNRRKHFYGKHSVTNTSLAIGINKTNNAGIPLAQPSTPQISIVSWDFNPASGNQDQEYVQLGNTNNFAVDISDWELDGGIHFKFKKGAVIPAGGSVYVSPNVRTFRTRANGPSGGQGLFVVGPCSGHLNAWGETLTLTQPSGWPVCSNSFSGNPSPAQRYLRITEIMYNPSPFPSITNDEQQFEYIELKNISTNAALNLTGVRFNKGISFVFSGGAANLAPQQTVVLARNQTAFTARYGNGVTVAGEFTGALDNSGDTLRLEDAVGEKILEFAYNDSWYPITDGLGFSLVIANENAPWNTWGDSSSWRPSGNLNGSPGGTDPGPPAFTPVIVNEVLTHTDLPQLDSIELYNPTTNMADIGGWFLTDNFYSPKKYRIPSGTTIPPRGYLVINENQFNTGPNAFRFSEYGESVWLFSGNAATNLSGYSQGYEFAEAPNGVSFGRYTNSQNTVFFTLQSAVTLGANNAYPRVGPIVISEIMYRPPDTNGADNDLDEFIELQNTSSTNVALYFASAPTNTWHLRNAVDFDFPTNQTLAAGARLLVVGFNPTNAAQLAAFRNKYGVSNSVAIYGPWSGKLDNSSETIELKQPDQPDLVNGVLIKPYIMIDRVAYRDEFPWPPGANGRGNSLQRISTAGFGNDPANWFAAGVTAGRATVFDQAPTVAISSPANGAVIVSTNGVIVSVSAGDTDGSLARIQLFGDGIELARWSSPSSNYLWAGAAAGPHELKARATDNLGAVTETPSISIVMVAPPPAINLLTPTNQAVLPANSTVVLAANATSGTGPAAVVSYFLDGVWIGSAAAPFNLNWTANPPGYHTLSAVAWDSLGQFTSTPAAPVFIQAALNNPVLISSGSKWRYLDNGVNQGAAWLSPNFNDNGWSSGFARLGFNSGNTGFATLLSYGPSSTNRYITYYFRQKFVVPTLTGMTNLYLEVQRDDGVAVYLNSTSQYRDNLPTGALLYSQLATNCSDNGSTWQTALLPLTNLLPGTNLLAAEVHQTSATSSDLVFDLRLTLRGSAFGPAITAQPQSRTGTNGQSANFSVTATGTGLLAYQWQHNGTNLPGAITNSLTLPTVSDSDAGFYQVVVTNSIGSVTSLVATLTVAALDTDGDGLPDSWELANGTNPLVNDAAADPDHDGMSNLQEYRAGTNPTNAASVLKFESVATFGSNLTFSFTAVSNRSYTIQSRSALGSGVWEKWMDILAVGSNRVLSITNGAGLNSAGFYRLVTPQQP